VLGDRVRAILGERLSAGDASPPARALAAVWGRVARVARPLAWPAGVQVVGVGSAVLGGAGKTPLAVALCRALPGAALVGHGYRARPGRARVVDATDALSLVGDDALSAAQLLPGTAVVVAPRRQAALDHAAALGHRLLVVDGLLQAAPRRVDLSILVLDAAAPWGSGACPPAGDLRAPRGALLGAADLLAAILPEGAEMPPALAELGAVAVPSRIVGAGGQPLSALAGLRLGGAPVWPLDHRLSVEGLLRERAERAATVLG
jgi:tetraacyldisaccharide 4'-kinase